MSSEKVSLIPVHPFIQSFVLSIIYNIRAKNFEYEEKNIVDADLVPQVSERVMMASMKERAVVAPRYIEKGKVEIRKRDMSALIAPIGSKVDSRNLGVGGMRESRMIRPEIRGQTMINNSIAMPPVAEQPHFMNVAPALVQLAGGVSYGDNYGKIIPLLNDPSVSSIECLGADKPIMVIRIGQLQRTRISLNELEIRKLLEGIADLAHVPFLEGVFRVVVNGLNVNAVVSGMIGSRFVIKKATAYGLLE
ncbi:MAG: hypothetical protein V1888_00940 [archaeon]